MIDAQGTMLGLIDPSRPGVTISEVREAADLLVAVRWDSPELGPATTWLRCSEREPEVVRQLVHQWIFEGEHDDPRISDVEPPLDVPCGGWLAPDGRLWRCSEITHRLTATRIVQQLSLSVGLADPEQWLNAHGWILVFENGVPVRGSSITQAQRDALFDLAIRFPTMRDDLMKSLRERDDG